MKANPVLHRMLEGVDTCIYIVDPQGNLVDANSAWQIYFGHKIDFVRGKPVKDILRDMIYARIVTEPGELPWEYDHPAALEVIKTGLPATTMLEKGISTVTARPVFDKQHELLYVVSTVSIMLKPDERRKKLTQPMRKVRHILVGDSPSMCKVKETIEKLADRSVNVLITGNTGTGKEVVADEIQMSSHRRKDPYVKINCAAVPDNLLESELFGYEPGAFTGASRNGKRGLFEAANHGTIFLDEIGDLPAGMQSKLLRVLQDQTFRKIGAVQEVRVDVRVIAATNENLVEKVRNGTFRKDLYYRLNVISIHIDDLDQRKEDIPQLAERFLREMKEKYEIDKTISADGIAYLQSCRWPGNVRQLGNIIERAAVLCSDTELNAEDFASCYSKEEQILESSLIQTEKTELPGENAAGESKEKTKKLSEPEDNDLLTLSGGNMREAVDILQERMIRSALNGGKSTYEAAQKLGISQPTLVRYAKKYRIVTGRKDTE